MKEKLYKIFVFLKNNIKWILLLVSILLLLLNIRSCSKNNSDQAEILRLENNLLAMNDTLENYKDKDGYNCAEMRAMQLTINELNNSLNLERNKEPITVIKYVATVNDTFNALTIIIHDTVNLDKNVSDKGTIYSHEKTVFDKSSRELTIETEYHVDNENGLLIADGDSKVDLLQDIWLETVLYKDKKGYTYARLKTDYPGITFNSGEAILVIDKKQEIKNRKQFGLGIGIQAGYGAMISNTVKMSPYIGIGVSLQWNPRFLQF